MKRVAVSLVAVVLAGSLAWAGEAVGVNVDVGVDVGTQQVKMFEASGGSAADYSTVVFQPYVQVGKFDEGLSGGGRIRGLFTSDKDTDSDAFGDVTASLSGWDIGGAVGWGFKVNDQVMVTPLLGLTYRSFSVELSDGGSVNVDTTMLTVDLGARLQAKLNDQLDFLGLLTISPIVSGEQEVDVADETNDITSGYVLELRAGAAYHLNPKCDLGAAVVYELLSEKVDWDPSTEDTLSKIALQLGATFKF